MGLFSKILNNKNAEVSTNIQCENILSINKFMNNLLSQNKYIAKSEYKDFLSEKEKDIEYFKILQNSNMLKIYCKNNHLSFSSVESILTKYTNFEQIIEEHNNNYINRTLKDEKEYLDNILQEVDPKINLDNDQRKVILTDEDYCLVIAGAGAGKTTTVAAKVKYLVEKKNIDPKQILVISFTNKAVQELRDKINKDMNIDCPITTFHSTGNAILRKQSPEKLNIVDSSKFYFEK